MYRGAQFGKAARGRQHGRDHTKGCSQSQTSDCSYGPVANGACEWQQVKGRMHWSEGVYWPIMKGVWAKWVGGGQWTGWGWGVGNAVARMGVVERLSPPEYPLC